MSPTISPAHVWHERLKWLVVTLLAMASLYWVFNIYASGQLLWGFGTLALIGLGFYVYLSNISFAYR